MSWVSELADKAVDAVSSALKNVEATVHVGANGTSVQVQDSRQQRFFVFAAVAVVVAYLIGHHFK